MVYTQYIKTEIQNGYQLATLTRTNPKIETVLSIAVANNLARFHENHLKTFDITLSVDKQTDGRTMAETLPTTIITAATTTTKRPPDAALVRRSSTL